MRIAAIFMLVQLSCYLSAEDGTRLAANYQQEVDRSLDLPLAEQRFYAEQAAKLLEDRNIPDPQYIVIVDRHKYVQALMVYWMAPDRSFHFIGGSPVSTGKPGRFDYFTTPLGVFTHPISNQDFRAEGTKNENGIRGYGRKGMRVFDFGWQTAEKGWGKGGEGVIRLQMHATDPDLLEKRLGSPQSKGCIRIPAALNVFLDHHAILDGDYDAATKAGKAFWVLSKTRRATPWSGRFLLIVDSERAERPHWSPGP